ncbi:TonB-dependent receptor [Asticcacaulis sp. EMRT-3]|uniref:TonB-dependent receptor plug domain-containing protein n=1 Tax=Asticcacaulis sp. EMRT-3 TaxID=3040349 RepID=UPI0024AFEB1E|nr:TonB-dependent receptor [Asticcacaulis sp. EMRT-3]MDI7775940.1 TonB-dependent receptor [Asticcacaulis sp. EMRT-3]
MRDVAGFLRSGASLTAMTAALCALPSLVQAQDTDQPTEVIVTGTRTTGLKAVDSPAPIQLVDSNALKRVGAPDLAAALSQSVPSFNVQSFGSDMANQTLSARLRGLSPNHTLVLVNGKRRHGTSNLAVLGGSFQGGAAADLSFIPVASIDHIEVLTDGAAAQYGTDAIAGVINIIQKKNDSGGTIALTGGQYFDGGGKTGDISFNIGLAPTPKSFLNLTYESKYHGYSDRGAADPRAANYPILATAPGYPYLNHIQGDGMQRLNVMAYNYGYQINDTWDLYSFGTYGRKAAASLENWRTPDKLPALYPLGFNPREADHEADYSATLGISGMIGKWGLDLATTYGEDDMDLSNYSTGNISLYKDTGFTPTAFYVGSFKGTQETTTLDLTRSFEVGMAEPLNLALGVEHRHETYGITQGDPASNYKEGAQAFPGFAATDAGSHSRNNDGVYADVSMKPIEPLLVDVAVRYEDYSDFGSTTVGKVTARYDFSPAVAVRGTISTGFRAPTMAEEYYSATNVSPTSAFVQLPPNSNAAKLLGVDGLKPEKSTNYSLGLVLHPTAKLSMTVDAYQIDIDDRIIGSGSIYGSGAPAGVPNLSEVTAAIEANGNVLDSSVASTGVNMFLNGADTTTKGVDVVLSYPTSFGHFGHVDWSLSGTYVSTEVKKYLDASSLLPAALLFDSTVTTRLEKQSPTTRVIGSALWKIKKLTVSLKETYYSKTSSVTLGPKSGTPFVSEVEPAILTDLDISYRLPKGLGVSIGANNLFNHYPEKINPGLMAEYEALGYSTAVSQYQSYSPFGFNGGYYYAKLTYSF